MAVVHSEDGERVILPDHLWRVEFVQGFGWPECTNHERAHRTYDDPARAAHMVATIKRVSTHHTLLGVWTASPSWSVVDIATGLPIDNDGGVGRTYEGTGNELRRGL